MSLFDSREDVIFILIVIFVSFVIALPCILFFWDGGAREVDIVVDSKEICRGGFLSRDRYYIKSDSGNYYEVRRISGLDQFDVGQRYCITVYGDNVIADSKVLVVGV